jgi:undecaprenyl-diphosphatase
MLDWLQIFALSIVQGITEFLPVSSSAHLILVPKVFGWSDQGLAFDIALHLGTLVAVLAYFRNDLQKMIRDFFLTFRGVPLSDNAKLLWSIGFATIPVGLAGLLLKSKVETVLRSPLVIAAATIIFGLVLWMADRYGKRQRNSAEMNWKDVFFIGCGQVLALIPGTSRSGITLTAGLARGLTRETAARFSFLLSIPVITLAAGLETLTLIKEQVAVQWSQLGFGLVLSAVSGYICIHYFLKLLNTMGMGPFVLYRLTLGLVLLFVFI